MDSTIHLNPGATSWVFDDTDLAAESQVLSFHEQLLNYAETPLHSLPAIAKELKLGHVFVKDESNRFGLPSFKILGASWAVFRALSEKLSLTFDTTLTDGDQLLSDLGKAAQRDGLCLVTCTEGNWGRAVARMARYLGIMAKVMVPEFVPEATIDLIKSEGVEVIVVNGNYDDSVAAARRESISNEKAMLIMDMGWDGYEIIPQWVVEGYSTMLNESDLQVEAATRGLRPTHVFVPVGVGSIAQAVTQHFKKSEKGHPCRAAVLAVEPATAAGLKASLEAGRISSVSTADTIMCGMNCGTISTTAWPVLQSGVDGDILVTDQESHAAVQKLRQFGIETGPCGASTLAALERSCLGARNELGISESSIVVLCCTEGSREYDVPE